MVASKHRPTRAIVDLSAISANIEMIKEELPQGVKTWAVVKADAYGHGAVAVAQHLESQVDGLCVSNLDEALELREAGIKGQILILGVIEAAHVGLAMAHQVMVTITSQEWLEQVLLTGQDLTGLQVHLKVDSGMGRVGMREASQVNQAMEVLTQQGAQVVGLFTHFATADEASQDKFQEQLARFKQILAELDDKPALIHASNSATSLWHPEGVFNAVRLGVAIYGQNPSGTSLPLPLDLRPALRLESQLVQVKQVAAGETIGYGATYTAQADEVIATVPIGYADGWLRRLQGFSILVDGQFCEIVGRVSMDQLTIRLPKAYPLGTVVTLLGQDGGQAISATDLAQFLGTINYEILCLISGRVPRFYR
ncbi:alanine racemase [Streptococcus cuniculipharyngis]|uniref:Alanine racemase n=1 Tax=Streptococcus cuniculipharyngis TaxID=1562651 RepID=A0A5C5SA60_9STRE|nr:alanine racemase [Streptococcus cuniculipharyngis]TWS96464.1 alanine racemase [Streptococcus cuniculipharyngis]